MPIYNRKAPSVITIDDLRRSLAQDVEELLSPLALRYGFSEEGLESHIKWQPCVLLLGNYSSGKSTLINELLGSSIQATGQAPTDDSFTIIAHSEDSHEPSPMRTSRVRDGKTLLSDETYPFKKMRRHGDRFAAHFRMLEVNSPFLKELVLIDTPGMLDSASEFDRGYNYQEVIGDLAEMADLILVLFDPHKAGTVRETHESLRNTLPMKTLEDRVIFVLNRVDECQNLNDLVRVYGTLCWNLSQMTGRKDIPPIYLAYAPLASSSQLTAEQEAFLKLIPNQRDEIRKKILDTPKSRLDRLATYLETKAQQLCHYLEGLEAYIRKCRARSLQTYLWISVVGLLSASLSGLSGVALGLAAPAHLDSTP